MLGDPRCPSYHMLNYEPGSQDELGIAPRDYVPIVYRPHRDWMYNRCLSCSEFQVHEIDLRYSAFCQGE